MTVTGNVTGHHRKGAEEWRMRVTIRDVAARSGVSMNTVSRVVNGKQDVDATARA